MLEVRIGAGAEEGFARLLGVTNDLQVQKVWPGMAKEAIHPFMLTHAKRQFATEGRYGGRPWRGYDLEPIYAAYKLRKVGHLHLLRWEEGGPYERVFPSLTDPNDEDHIFRVGRNSVSIGSAVGHAYDLTIDTTGPFDEPSPGRDIFAMTAGQAKSVTTDMHRKLRRDLARRGVHISDVRSNL